MVLGKKMTKIKETYLKIRWFFISTYRKIKQYKVRRALQKYYDEEYYKNHPSY